MGLKIVGVFVGFVGSVLISASANAEYKTYYTIAQDGSGDFKTISKALLDVKSFPNQRVTLYVKNGVYQEKVHVPEWNTNLSIIGQSQDKTVVEWADHFKSIKKGRNSTFYTATMQVDADNFEAKNLTIRNTAGPVGQAIALAVNANKATFDHVYLDGHQDTLYVTGAGNKMRFSHSVITGTTDFIFGGASAVFDQCTIVSKANSYVTAASTPKGAGFGLVFVQSKFEAVPGVNKVYLGRPWRDHAQTVVVNSYLGAHILPQGWHDWGKTSATNTVYYAEHGNHGPGAGLKGRVKWMKPLGAKQVKQFESEALLNSFNLN